MNKKKKPRIRFKGFNDDWEQRKLSDVIDVCSGMDYKHLSEGNIPVYGTGGYMLSVNKALSYDKDAIGLGRKGTIDKPYILKAPFWTVDTLFYCIPKPECSLAFLYGLFQRVNWKQKDESTGVPSLSKVAINGTNIMVPSTEEQRRIGEYFSKVDHLITLHQRKCEKLKIVKKSMLENCFPKNGQKVPKIRFSGFTDDWEQRKVSEMADRYDTMRIPVTANRRVPGDTPYYGANGIQDYVKGYTHDGEFVLVAEDGANDLKNYPIHYVNGKIWVNNHAHVLQAKSTEADNRFLQYAISRADIESVLVGGGRAKLNANILMDIDITLPNLPEQKKIGGYFQCLDSLITLHQRKLEKLQKIKKSMLERMFV